MFTVLHCTLLAQAQSESEKELISLKMRNDQDLLPILLALEEEDKEDIVQEERSRRQAVRQSRVDADLQIMDTEEGGVSRYAIQLF